MHVKTDGKGGSFIYKGGDRMNFLRICRYLYTKKLFGEIVLFIQLICMLVICCIKTGRFIFDGEKAGKSGIYIRL